MGNKGGFVKGVGKGFAKGATSAILGSAIAEGLVDAGTALSAETLGLSLGVVASALVIGYGGDALGTIFFPDVQPITIPKVNNNLSDYTSGLYNYRLFLIKPPGKQLNSLSHYFNNYGYNRNVFEKPNLKAREGGFTYIKTSGAIVKSANKDCSRLMEMMLNAGTKFYHNEVK